MRKLLRFPQVIELTGRSKSRIYADIAKGKFPAPVKIGAKAVAWVEDEIAAHNEALIAERDRDTAA